MKAAVAILLAEVLSVPVGQWATVQQGGAKAAWTSDGAVVEAVAHDGLVMVFGKTAGRTRVVIENAAGATGLEVETIASGEERTSADIRTATIELSNGRKLVQYAAVDGLALLEGDIVLGTVEELESQPAPPQLGGPAAQGIGASGSQFRWPGGVIPFTIDARLAAQSRVTEAIAHWETKTNFRFVRRSGERDFVTFRPGIGCSSWVGRRGGQQFVTLGAECGPGTTIHEIGHTIGLWHEHSREDRDGFVRIDYSNIRPENFHNFSQHVSDGNDVGAYDYASIMHYPRTAFSIDGNDTIVPADPKALVGQRDGLSAGDVAAANSLCLKQDSIAGGDGKRRSVGRG